MMRTVTVDRLFIHVLHESNVSVKNHSKNDNNNKSPTINNNNNSHHVDDEVLS